MNANEVAKVLGMHPDTIRRLIREGEIKAEKKGRSYDIPKSEVSKFRNIKGIEDIAVDQERAAYQLLINAESEIAADLAQIQRYAVWLERDMKRHEISTDDFSNETYEKRLKIYQEDELSSLAAIVTAAKNIARLENFTNELKKIISEAEEGNSPDKAKNKFDNLFNLDTHFLDREDDQ